MCIIIDTNVLTNVFKESSVDHAQFKPVRDWIINGKGKVVFGGTKYIEEINGKYLALFSLLRKAGKAVFINNALVDAEHSRVEAMITHPDFDDPHLVGLLRVSGCKLICSLDSRAFPYFRHSLFFTPAANKPKIYSTLVNATLLSDKYIGDVCKPCSTTTKKQKALIGSV